MLKGLNNLSKDKYIDSQYKKSCVLNLDSSQNKKVFS